MGGFFDPLDHLWRNPNRPNNFRQKFRDTFEFFAGYPFDLEELPLIEGKPFHIGLFDILTLGIPELIFMFNLIFFNRVKNIAAKIALGVPLVIISAPLLLVRAAFALILTVGCILFIGLAQCFDQRKTQLEKTVEAEVEVKIEKMGERIKGLEVQLEAKAQELAAAQSKANDSEKTKLVDDIYRFKISKMKGKPTVRTVLETAGTNLDEIKITDNTKSNGHHKLRFFKPMGISPIADFKLKLEKKHHQKMYDALCALNVGNIKPK